MKVLFVCRSNVGRSQIAATFFRRFSKNGVDSAGLAVKPSEEGELPPQIIRFMKRGGYDVFKYKRKRLTKDMIRRADRIIILLTPSERRVYVSKFIKNLSKVTFWNVKDPRWSPYSTQVRVHERIKKLVKELVKEIG